MTNGNPFEAALTEIRTSRSKREEERAVVASQLREIDADIRRLAAAEKALMPKDDQPRETSVDKARVILQDRPTITQSELAKLIDVPKNTARHALDRLAEEGVVKRTGKLVNRSPEFATVNGSR